jgi:8-oxo-dGTP pyrophosphatase MutT (NUDIX family)
VSGRGGSGAGGPARGAAGAGGDRGPNQELAAALRGYLDRAGDDPREAGRVREVLELDDPWDRSTPLHVTGSAVVVHPATRRVLLRWHDLMRAWLHVGGHASPGETSPFAVALREAREETSLPDLEPWPDPSAPLLVDAVVVPVPEARGMPAHEHCDLRYLLSTRRPEAARAEKPSARIRWLTLAEAVEAVGEDNLQITLARVAGPLSQRVP